MKNFSKILLASLLTLSLASCGEKNNVSSNDEEVKNSEQTEQNNQSGETEENNQSSDTEEEKGPDTTLTFALVEKEVTLNALGEYKGLTCKYGENEVKDVTFAIENAEIADLVNGVVIAKGYGETTVTATYVIGDVTKTDTCSVKVNEPVIDTTKTFDLVDSDIKFNQIGETKVLTAKYGDDEVRDVKYSVDNPIVCEVVNGVVISKMKGNAKITASYKIGDITKTDSCNVVCDAKVEIEVTYNNEPLNANKEYSVELGKTLSFKSKYTSLPSVNDNLQAGISASLSDESKGSLKKSGGINIPSFTFTPSAVGDVTLTIEGNLVFYVVSDDWGMGDPTWYQVTPTTSKEVITIHVIDNAQ